jgi:hypothetical protein
MTPKKVIRWGYGAGLVLLAFVALAVVRESMPTVDPDPLVAGEEAIARGEGGGKRVAIYTDVPDSLGIRFRYVLAGTRLRLVDVPEDTAAAVTVRVLEGEHADEVGTVKREWLRPVPR